MGYFVQDDAVVPARIPEPHTRFWELSGVGLRYYTPLVGRWASRDPIGERGGVNLSMFVDNNAVGGIDPTGTECCKCLKMDVTVGPFEKYTLPIGFGRMGIRITGIPIVEGGTWRGVTSPVIDLEVGRMSDTKRLTEVMLMTTDMRERVEPEEADRARADEMIEWGFKALDALHLACAEKAKVDVFLTTDDLLLKVAARIGRSRLRVKVANPLQWFGEVLKDEIADTGTERD